MKKRFFLICLCVPCVVFSQQLVTDTVPGVSNLLALSLEELMNIKVVTATGYLQTTAEAPSTITVITAKQIAERGYEQLEDALRNVPGIDMIHVNGYVPTLIYFRGMYGAENQRALLMIDGIAENNILGTNDVAGPAYNLHNAERIEIIWGPASALYGANAFGGVINIITKKGADISGVHAEKGYGSFNTTYANLTAGMRYKQWEFSTAASVYSTDGPKFSNRDPEYHASFTDRAFSLNTSLTYYTPKTKTTLGFRTYRTPMGWGTYANSPTVYLGLPLQGNFNDGTVGVITRDFRGEKPGIYIPFLRTLSLQNEWSPGSKLKLNTSIVYRETGADESSYIYITIDSRTMYRGRIADFSSRVSGELNANFTPGKHSRFTAGLQVIQDNVETGARKTTFDPTPYVVENRDTVVNIKSTYLPREYDIRNNIGGYLQYVLNSGFAKKTEFTFGLRFDHNSYFGDAVSPRIVVVNQPTEKLTLKVQFGTAFRAPTNLEIHQANLNFQLKKEKVVSWELNAIYALSGKIRLQSNVFLNNLSDVILLTNLSGLNPNKNPGKLEIYGAEAVADFNFSKSFSGFANFTYQHPWGKNLITGLSRILPGMARVKGNMGLTFYTADLLNFSLNCNWIGERNSPRTDPYGPVAGYFLTNAIFGSKKLLKDKVSVSIAVNNIFNIKWLDPGFRTAEGLLYSTVLEQPGRTGQFKIGVSF